MAEMIALKRSNFGRKFTELQNMTVNNFTWRTKKAMLKKAIFLEKPEIQHPVEVDDGQLWVVEKQFFLKHKLLFQDMGYLPAGPVNPVTGKLYMLEKY